MYQVGEIAAYIVVLAGLSLLTGANGQISLGHGGFMAVGAYTLGLFMTHTGTNFVLELVAAAAVAAVAGVVIGLPATRLKGPYLAGMTLLFALAVPSIADKWPATFGGDQGLTVSAPTAPGSLGQEEWLAWIQILGAADRPRPPGQPLVEPLRARLPRRTRRRDRRVTGRDPRGADEGGGVRH